MDESVEGGKIWRKGSMSSSDATRGDERVGKADEDAIQKARTILSRHEVESIVRGFILSWIRGQLKVSFPYIEEIQGFYKRKGQKIDKERAWKLETGSKGQVENTIAICVGTQPSTSAQLEVAINEMFSWIMVLRQGDRIEGTFLNANIEDRLTDIESKLNANNNVLEKLISWLTEEAKGSG